MRQILNSETKKGESQKGGESKRSKKGEVKKIEVDDEVAEAIRMFDMEDTTYEVFDHEVMINMTKQEKYYNPDPHYFESCQTHINWLMRGILLNWMTEVCVDLMFKRDTYYLSVNYLDRYLSKSTDVEKWQLQLVGTAALYIAQKMDELEPQKVY